MACKLLACRKRWLSATLTNDVFTIYLYQLAMLQQFHSQWCTNCKRKPVPHRVLLQKYSWLQSVKIPNSYEYKKKQQIGFIYITELFLESKLSNNTGYNKKITYIKLRETILCKALKTGYTTKLGVTFQKIICGSIDWDKGFKFGCK